MLFSRLPCACACEARGSAMPHVTPRCFRVGCMISSMGQRTKWVYSSMKSGGEFTVHVRVPDNFQVDDAVSVCVQNNLAFILACIHAYCTYRYRAASLQRASTTPSSTLPLGNREADVETSDQKCSVDPRSQSRGSPGNRPC